MEFSALQKTDRKAIVNGIIMDNKNVTAIVNNSMEIFKKLNKEQLIQIYKIIIPNSSFTIMDGDRIILQYTNPNKICSYWITYWNREYSSYYTDGCFEKGTNQCFRYVTC